MSGISIDVPPDLVNAIAAQVAAELKASDSLATNLERSHPERLTLSKAEAAQVLGVSVDHLERHVLPDLRVVRSGRLRLIPRDELETWVRSHSARALEADR